MKLYAVRENYSGQYFDGYKFENHKITEVHTTKYPTIDRLYMTIGPCKKIITDYYKGRYGKGKIPTDTEKILYEKYELEIVEFELVETKK